MKVGLRDSGGEGHVEPVMACLAFVPGNRSSLIDSEFVPEVRGVYPLGQSRLTCGFPFGLTETSRPLRVDVPLLVWPRTFPVSPLPEAAEGHSAVGVAVRDRAGNWGDLLGVRPYRRGDSIRRVHWGQTARQGELIVCEVQSNSVPRVQIVLDTHQGSHAGEGAQGSREWSIRIAASLAEGWIGEGADVGLLLESGSVIATGRTAKARTTIVLDALARLKAGGGSDLSSLLDLTESRQGRSGLRVVITTDVGLKRLFDSGKFAQTDRFVVLRSRGFGGADRGDDSSRLPLSPWIWIDGPRGVATALLRNGKGAMRESRNS